MGCETHARRGRVSGFSLIELLVVIAILAVLIGIALPVIGVMRARATKAACASNLRQIGIAISIYVEQHDRHMPTARYMPEPLISGDDDPPLTRLLQPHLGPAVDVKNPAWRCPGDHANVFPVTGSSYMYQSELSGVRLQEFFPVKHLDIPLSRILVARDFDGGQFDLTDGATLDVPFFHDERNLLFADGRVGNFQTP